MPLDLPDGLVLRSARPGDLDQIGALLIDRGEPADALDHRLVVDDPDAGWEACAVVVDGDRVVSTATLLDETLELGGVSLPAGQVELVATDREYEGRGLVRALMTWAHERSAARGQLVQVMVGIPYFYRLFGYAYAIDIPRSRRLVAAPRVGAGELRVARRGDIPALVHLQASAQGAADVVLRHSGPCWRWLIDHDGTSTWLLDRGGVAVATGRVRADDDEWLVAEIAAVDPGAAGDLVSGLAARAPGLRVVDRPGTAWDSAPVELGPPGHLAEQYYLRIPDVVALLGALRPVLWDRLVTSGLDRLGRDVVLSTFGAHFRLPVGPTGLGDVVRGAAMQAPGVAGGAGVAPDQLGALLFGGAGMHGLCRVRPDVYPGPDVDLFEALFPPLRADLSTYYLPF